MARLLPVAAAAATLVLLAALYFYGANLDEYWTADYRWDTQLHAGIAVLLAGALYVWNRNTASILLAAAAALYLAGGLGILQSLSALLVAVASLLLGRRVLACMFPGQSCSATAAVICGLAVYLTLFGIMIHFPVNYRGVYVLLFCAPLAVEALAGRLPVLRQEISSTVMNVRAAVETVPGWMFAAGTIGGVLVARLAFMPSMAFDDNALHLGLWTQLRHEHVYAFDYISQIWEVAPFIVDMLHASVNLVAGADARGATNVLLLCMLLRQLWVILGALRLDAGKRLLALALFVSTPMTGYLLLTLQTELFLAVLTATGVRLVLELRGNWCSAHTAALLAIAALCCGSKLPGAVLGVALLAAAVLRLRSTRGDAEQRASTRSVLMLVAFTAVLALLAFNAYATAWAKTGNPVFPLYNAIFKSPWYEPYNFSDPRWIKGFNPASYWDLFFNTSGYMESRNFVAGFQYLLLLPLGLVTLLSVRSLRSYAAPLLIPLLGFGLIMFASTQYWRYQFPVLPLAAVVIAALLVPQYSRQGRWLVQAALLVCVVLNFAFHPGITSFLQLPPGAAWTAGGKRFMLEDSVPARALNAWINEYAPGSRVLYPAGVPYGATLHGTPIYVNWYSPTNSAAFFTIRDETDGLAFLRDQNVDYVVAHMNDPGLPGTMAWGLRRFLARVGVPVKQAGDHILYRFDGGEAPYKPHYIFEQRLAVDATPHRLDTIMTGAATAVRYSAEFACADKAGYFVAQINWDNGEYYYHRIECSGDVLQFTEGLPIPPNATSGDLYVYVNETTAATLTRLSIEILE